MPLGDGTGPAGKGRMTGRWVGFCSGSGKTGYTSNAPPRRMSAAGGLGRRGQPGRGRGLRRLIPW